jgi:dodecin
MARNISVTPPRSDRDRLGALGIFREGRQAMSVAKVIEVSATSTESFDDAVKVGIQKSGETLRNIQGAWVSEQKVDVEDGRIVAYRVTLRITFILE